MMSQLNGQPEVGLQDGQPPVDDPQAATGQLDGQGVAAGQQAAPPADGPSISIPRHTVPKHYKNDVYAAFKDANEYHTAAEEGWTETIRVARAKGMKPWQIQQLLDAGQNPAGQIAAPPAPQAKPQAARQQFYDQFGQPVVTDPEDDPVLKRITESDKKYKDLEDKFSALQENLTVRQRQQAEQEYTTAWNAAKARADASIKKAITSELGIAPNPRKGKWLGEDSEGVDPEYDRVEAQVERAVWKLRTRTGVNSDLPPTEDEIAFVVESLKPYYAVQDELAAGRVAARQQNKPKGAVPAGTGGGVSRKPKPPQNAEEMRASMREDARALLHG